MDALASLMIALILGVRTWAKVSRSERSGMPFLPSRKPQAMSVSRVLSRYLAGRSGGLVHGELLTPTT